MWSTQWKFIVLCGLFSFQVLSLPYILNGSLFGSPERSIAAANAEFISNSAEAESLISRTKGILYKIEHFDWSDKSEENYRNLLRYERDLNIAENSLVAYLSQLSQSEEGLKMEAAITELSISITELNLNEMKRIFNKATES